MSEISSSQLLANTGSTRLRLQRTFVALMLVHFNVYVLVVAAFLVIGGLMSRRLDTVVVGVVVSVGCLSPALMGADVDPESLRTGYRWRRRVIPLAEVAEVRIGTVRRFGFGGGDAMGMKIVLRSGKEVLVRESQFCSKERLRSWGDTISLLAPEVRVTSGPPMELE